MKKEILQFAPQINNITFVRNFLEEIREKYRLSRNLMYKVELAVEEAITNIIRHGYQGNGKGQIRMETYVRHFSFTIVIVDSGKEFDPRQVVKPDLQQYVQVGKIGGLGIMMIKKLIDDIDYKITKRGNELYLVKYRKNVSFFKCYQIFICIRHFFNRLRHIQHKETDRNTSSLDVTSKPSITQTATHDKPADLV